MDLLDIGGGFPGTDDTGLQFEEVSCILRGVSQAKYRLYLFWNFLILYLTAVSLLLAQDAFMDRHLPMDTSIPSLDHSCNQPSPGQIFPY